MNIEKYPILGDSLQWVSREDYISINLGRWNKQYGDILTRRKLLDMLSMVEGSFQCNPQEDSAIQDIWREMEQDIALAKDPPCEVVETELLDIPDETVELHNAVAAVSSQSEPNITDIRTGSMEVILEPENPEQALAARAVEDFVIAKGFADFHRRFDLGPKMLNVNPKADASNEDLIDALAFQLLNNTASEWAVGRLVNLLVERGVENVVIQVCGQLNRNYQTVSRWARTEKNIPPELRDPRLPISAYSEIGCARFSKDKTIQADTIKQLCEKAVSEGWGVAEARAAVTKAQGKKEKPMEPLTPPAPAKPRFLVIEKSSFGEGGCIVYVSQDEPSCDCSRICIDIERLEYAIECHSEKAHAWLPCIELPREEVVLEAELEEAT